MIALSVPGLRNLPSAVTPSLATAGVMTGCEPGSQAAFPAAMTLGSNKESNEFLHLKPVGLIRSSFRYSLGGKSRAIASEKRPVIAGCRLVCRSGIWRASSGTITALIENPKALVALWRPVAWHAVVVLRQAHGRKSSQSRSSWVSGLQRVQHICQNAFSARCSIHCRSAIIAETLMAFSNMPVRCFPMLSSCT